MLLCGFPNQSSNLILALGKFLVSKSSNLLTFAQNFLGEFISPGASGSHQVKSFFQISKHGDLGGLPGKTRKSTTHRTP